MMVTKVTSCLWMDLTEVSRMFLVSGQVCHSLNENVPSKEGVSGRVICRRRDLISSSEYSKSRSLSTSY
jgi:hypothetical protein